MQTNTSTSTGTGARGGPPLLVPAVAVAVLTITTLALHPGTRPGADPTATLTLLRTHEHGAEVSALALLASAVPLAVWSAATQHRLHRLGLRVAGPWLGHVGGVLAACLLAVSAITGWAAASVATASTAPAAGTAAVSAALTEVSFAAGGPGFAIALALLMVGVAVPGLRSGLLSRANAIAAFVLAGVAVVALGALVVPVLGILLPVVRFGGLAWLLWTSAVLPVSRRRTTSTPGPVPGLAAPAVPARVG